MRWIIEQLYQRGGVNFAWQRDANAVPAESTFLKLDASKARARLGWPKLDLPTTLQWIVDWTRHYPVGADVRDVSIADVDRYMASKSNLDPTLRRSWAYRRAELARARERGPGRLPP